MNDIAAMKTADISAALLTGYGNEKSSKQSLDFENERRKTKLGERLIGNNRLVINKTRSKNQHRTLQERIALQKGGTGKLLIEIIINTWKVQPTILLENRCCENTCQGNGNQIC